MASSEEPGLTITFRSPRMPRVRELMELSGGWGLGWGLRERRGTRLTGQLTAAVGHEPPTPWDPYGDL